MTSAPGATVVWLLTTRNTEMKDADVGTVINERLQVLDAALVQRCSAQIRLYKEPQQRGGAPPKSLYLATTSRVPNRSFCVINDSCVEGSGDLELIVGKLRTMYALRQTISLAGHEYLLGDFSVRLGSIGASTVTARRGVMLEIEYKPLTSLAVALPVINDLLQAIVPEGVHAATQHMADPVRALGAYRLGPAYSHMHTVCQYLLALQAEEFL